MLTKLLFLLCIPLLSATEYFVSPAGDDNHPGSREQPFATINKGVHTLQGGDTLTILPGRYYEWVERRDLGVPDKTTLIRAAYPESVLLHGDLPCSGWTQVPGTQFTYCTDWKENVNAVNERDTLKIFLPAGTLQDLEFKRELWYYDRDAGKLYISTSDGLSPEQHLYSVSVLIGNGLFIQNPVNVIIEGLMVSGFYSHYRVENRISSGLYGIRINHPQNSIVRNCRVFFNANGIHSGHGDGGVLEDCVAYANGSYNPSSGGNIVIWCPAKNGAIRNCLSFFSAKPGGRIGIRIYGGAAENCLIENCMSFGEDAMGIKATNINSFCRNNYCDSGVHCVNSANNTSGGVNAYNTKASDLRIDKIPRQDWDKLFADPDNHDFRPQGNVAGLENGIQDRGDVFFLSPLGNDSWDGRSVSSAWKSFRALPPDSTAYLLPGIYDLNELSVPGVTLKTRGSGMRAIFQNGLQVSAERVTIDGLNFVKNAVQISGRGSKIRNCGFAVPLQISGEDFLACHNAFTIAPQWDLSKGWEHSNLFPDSQPAPQFVNHESGDFTLKNASAFAGRGLDSLPLGPYRLIRESKPAVITGPFVRSVTATTANIEWWTDRKDVTTELMWGPDESCGLRAGQSYASSYYHSVTLTGLIPGKQYFGKIASRAPAREHHGNSELALADRFKPRELITSPVFSLTTAETQEASRTYYVSPEGNNQQDGSASAPWQTISRALDQAKAGDVIEVRGGTYREALVFRSGGDREHPLTLRSAAGETVILDGFRVLTEGIILDTKSHVVIDGFHFRDFNDTCGAGILIKGGSEILIRRCFYDGRCNGYTPHFIDANSVSRLTLENCVIIRGFNGARFWRCPDLTIRNCVWYMNQIDHMYIHNQPEEKALLEKNIFCECSPSKYPQALLGVHHLEALQLRQNAFYLRMPEIHRRLLSFGRFKGELLSVSANRQTLADYGVDISDIYIDNPQIPVLPEPLRFSDNPEKYPQEAEELQKSHPAVEQHLQKNGTYAPWSFPQFFAQNPELNRLDIGLQPAQFQK